MSINGHNSQQQADPAPASRSFNDVFSFAGVMQRREPPDTDAALTASSMDAPARPGDMHQQLEQSPEDHPKGLPGRFMFVNPNQETDYRIIETHLRNGFPGALADSLVRYIIGRGFEPELELINPDADNAEANRSEIADNQHIITRLKKIDMYIDRHANYMDTTFSQKLASVIASCLLYNRGSLIYHYHMDEGVADANGQPIPPVTIEGKEYPEIPVAVTSAHARDLGIIEMDVRTNRLTGVQWRYYDMMTGSPVIGTDHMLYLWNSATGGKFARNWYYGSSLLTPALPAIKLVQKLVTEDFPAMAEVAWTSNYFLIVNNEGGTEEQKRAEHQTLISQFRAGQPGILVKDPEDVSVESVDLESKVQDFVALYESMIKTAVSIFGLPQVGFFDESAANYATMVGKIRLTTQTTIDPLRQMLGEQIARQWYDRWFRLIYHEDQDMLRKFRIKIKWTNMHVTDWRDDIEALMKLDSRHQLTDEAFGELMGEPSYATMLDEDEETNAGGQQQQDQGMGGMPGQGVGGPQGPGGQQPGQGPQGPGGGGGGGPQGPGGMKPPASGG